MSHVQIYVCLLCWKPARNGSKKSVTKTDFLVIIWYKLRKPSSTRSEHLWSTGLKVGPSICAVFARAYLNFVFWIWQQQLPVASFIFVHAIFWCLSQVLVLLSTPLNVLNQSVGPHLHSTGNSRIWLMSNNSVTVFLNVERTSTDYSILLHFKSPLADKWNREIGGFREFDVCWTG